MNLSGDKPKILIVDDDAHSRKLILDVLKMLSLDTAIAENGHDGFLKFQSWQPAVVITDLQMPIMDGLELIQSIRNISSTPIVAISGETDMLSKALLLGANISLEKPFSIDEMLALVKTYLK